MSFIVTTMNAPRLFLASLLTLASVFLAVAGLPARSRANLTAAKTAAPASAGVVYADYVIGFSSERSSTDSSAAQALGAPDTNAYGDFTTAWSPLTPNSPGLEFISVGYSTPAYADSVTVWETFGNGFVTQIDLIDTSDVLHTVFAGTDPSAQGSPVGFTVSFPRTPYQVKGVKVTVNALASSSYEEIDSIALGALVADLTVTKLGPNQATADSDVTYTIEVLNSGPDASVSASLHDSLPSGTTFVSLSSPANWSCSTPNPGAGGSVDCTISNLPAGSDDTFTLVVHINPNASPGTTYTNTASVSGSDDPNSENNNSSASTTISGGTSADLGVTKTTDADTSVADSDVTFTISVVNGGPNNAMGATLNDTLPGNMTFVSIQQTSGPTWMCSTPGSGSGGTISCSATNLPVGSNSTFVLIGHIPPGAPSGQIYTNTATVTSADDPNSENDRAATSVTVVAAAPTLTTQTSAPVILGGAISDTATLSGGVNPTGAISFLAYGPNDTNCSGTVVFSSDVDVNGNGQYTSGSFVPTAAGTYRFVATYSGDFNNKSFVGTCNDANESVVVTAPTPTPTATATATATPTSTPTATPTATPPAQALNLSTRLSVGTGDRVAIGGFIITGQVAKSVVLRGLGPSLSRFGLSGVLLDPMLELRGSNGSLIFQNDNWRDTQQNQIQGTPFQPTDDRESVIITSLQPASYTVTLTGKNGTTGIGAVEIYDNSQGPSAELANISTRGFVQTDDKVMIGGFILGAYTGGTRIAIRGRGPSLSSAGVTNVLADPTLEMRDANGATIVFNDDWQSDPVSAGQLTANGLALSNPKESGLFRVMGPGQFTVILAGKNGGIGNGLIEIYNLK